MLKKILFFILLSSLCLFINFASAQEIGSFLKESYNQERDILKNIKKAGKQAEKNGKNILIIAGNDSCGWCKLLTEFLEKDAGLTNYINKYYIPLKVFYLDKKFTSKYPNPAKTPHLYVLDSKGKVLISQTTELFEAKKYWYKETIVLNVLKSMVELKEKVLAPEKELPYYSLSYRSDEKPDPFKDFEEAKKEAKKRNANIFVLLGKKDCPWCRVFDAFITVAHPQIYNFLNENFVFLKMKHKSEQSEKFIAQFSKEIKTIPYFLFFDKEGKLLKQTSTVPLETFKITYNRKMIMTFLEEWTTLNKVVEEPLKDKLPPFSISYDEKAKPFEDLEKAKALAQKDKKNILVFLGGDWCQWCKGFDKFIRQNKKLNNYLHNNFVLLRVFYDGTKNTDFIKKYGDKKLATPHIYLLDAKGKLTKSESSAIFEDGLNYNKKKFFKFLKKHSKNN